MRVSAKPLALLMVLVLCPAWSSGSPNPFIHVRTDFLASDSTTYYTLENWIKTVPGNNNSWTDSTFLVQRDNGGLELSRELLRADVRVHCTDNTNRYWWETKNEFLSVNDIQHHLARKGLSLALPIEIGRDLDFEFQVSGVQLSFGDQRALLIPAEVVVRAFPEYSEIVKYKRQSIRWLNMFRGPSTLYLHLQGDCLDSDVDCRQVVIPLDAEFFWSTAKALRRQQNQDQEGPN